MNAVNWDEQPLGKQTDASLAKELGVSVKEVYLARIKRGIYRYREDLSWLRFGRLVAVNIASRSGPTYWNCLCDCGKQRKVKAALLKRGAVRDCGCVRRKKSSYTLWDEQPFGEITDAEISRRIGESRTRVRSERIRRGMPSFRDLQKVKSELSIQESGQCPMADCYGSLDFVRGFGGEIGMLKRWHCSLCDFHVEMEGGTW